MNPATSAARPNTIIENARAEPSATRRPSNNVTGKADMASLQITPTGLADGLEVGSPLQAGVALGAPPE
jgi:hypothetical protein